MVVMVVVVVVVLLVAAVGLRAHADGHLTQIRRAQVRRAPDPMQPLAAAGIGGGENVRAGEAEGVAEVDGGGW